MARILLVEDDRTLSTMIKDALESDNHSVEVADEGETGLEFLQSYQFDIIILDWQLPGLSGPEICADYRRRGGKAPVIFLTARNDILDKGTGFEAGADDYLTKPFDIRELLMRITALLRRPSETKGDVLSIGGLEVNPRSGKVTLAGADIKLQPRELALLEFLMRHPDTLFSAEALLDRVWDADADASNVAIRSCVAKLRRKLAAAGGGNLIESVRGLGYKMNSSSAE